MPHSISLAIIISLLIVTACNSQEPAANHSQSASARPPADRIAATVNGSVISKDEFTYFKTLKSNPQVSDDRLLEEMIATELLRQQAIKEGIADKAEVKYQIKLQTSQILARALMREKFAAVTFSDEALRAAYDQQVNNAESREFKARHILLKTQDEAKAVIEALKNGGDFIELAKQRSTGPSGPNGGDLGWFQAARMVPPFAEAVKAMNKGDISVSPVQTSFGWHVIKLEDIRTPEKPAFDSMRDQLHQSLIREEINKYIDEIHAGARIDSSP